MELVRITRKIIMLKLASEFSLWLKLPFYKELFLYSKYEMQQAGSLKIKTQQKMLKK